MNKPTKEQIKNEIEKLTEIKPKVRHFSIFGDDNHKCIEAQIEVLTDNLSYEQIENKWGGEVCDENAPAQEVCGIICQKQKDLNSSTPIDFPKP